MQPPPHPDIAEKVVIITGAGSGFGRLVSHALLEQGAKVVAVDIDSEGLAETASHTPHSENLATEVCDVTDLTQLQQVAQTTVERYQAIDVMVNNAGTMPLAFFRDHADAKAAWSKCIDINFKGVLNGITAVHDQMLAQGRGHVINLSSIYGNFPVAGAGVYGATKAAVNFLSESLRVESQGKIKVTTIKPTGVPGTKLGSGIINPDAITGILGQNTEAYLGQLQGLQEGTNEPGLTDPHNPQYAALDPTYIAEAIVHAIAQPWGVSVADITVRATGDGYVL